MFLYLRIIGLYIGLVLLFAKFIRGIMTGFLERIMFTELPYVDRVLQVMYCKIVDTQICIVKC